MRKAFEKQTKTIEYQTKKLKIKKNKLKKQLDKYDDDIKKDNLSIGKRREIFNGLIKNRKKRGIHGIVQLNLKICCITTKLLLTLEILVCKMTQKVVLI